MGVHEIKGKVLQINDIISKEEEKIAVGNVLTYPEGFPLSEFDLVYRKWVEALVASMEVFLGSFETLEELEEVDPEEIPEGAYAYIGSGEDFKVYFWESETWVPGGSGTSEPTSELSKGFVYTEGEPQTFELDFVPLKVTGYINGVRIDNENGLAFSTDGAIVTVNWELKDNWSLVFVYTKIPESVSGIGSAEAQAKINNTLELLRDVQGGIAGNDTTTGVINSIDDLPTLNRNGKSSLLLRDDGGNLFYDPATLIPNGGTIFPANGGGSWFRGNAEVLNIRWFGAKGIGSSHDDTSAIQACFDFIQSSNKNYSVFFPTTKNNEFYYVTSTINLPRTNSTRFLNINGYGATIYTNQPGVTIFNRIPANQTEAGQIISASIPIIKGITFKGTFLEGQIGVHLGATYSSIVENCVFENLYHGSIGTFCLNSKWTGLRYTNCVKFPLTLRSAAQDYYGVQVWTGGSLSNSASNVSVIDGCRVFGRTDQIASYTILASDAVTLQNSVSEGNSGLFDVYYDSQGSTTNKNFRIFNLHCEAFTVKVNLRIKANGGIVVIDALRRSAPASLLDVSGSVATSFKIKNLAYTTGLVSGRPWFYHTGSSGGYVNNPDGTLNNGRSSGSNFEFSGENLESFKSGSVWEGGLTPFNLVLNGNLGANEGGYWYSNQKKTIAGENGSPLELKDAELRFSPDNTYDLGRRTGFAEYYRPKGVYAGDGGFVMKDKTNTDILLASGGTRSIYETVRNSATSTNYNLEDYHFSKSLLQLTTNVTGVLPTVTVTNDTLPAGGSCSVMATGINGRFQIVAGAGITLSVPSGYSTTSIRRGTVTLYVITSTLILVTGDLEPLQPFSKVEKPITSATDYTSILEDRTRYLAFENSIPYTIPSGIFVLGDEIEGHAEGGNVTIVGSGVTINKPASKSLVVESGGAFKLRFILSSIAYLTGDLV